MAVDIEDQRCLMAYLRTLGKVQSQEEGIVECLTGGVSNKTVLLTLKNGEEWVIKQALDKLRVKEDWYCDEGRIDIEYKALRWLSGVLPKGAVPEAVFFDEPNHVLCMTAVRQPHDNLKTLILSGIIRPGLFKKSGELLGTIQRAGRNGEAGLLFHNRQYFNDLRVEPFYQFTAGRLPESAVFYERLVSRTLNITTTVCHGDYSPKNILVSNGDIVLLDYEVMHYGDPAFDPGFFLCQMLCFANHLPNVRQELNEAAHAFWNSYVSAAGQVSVDAGQRVVDHTLGCLLARVKGRSPVDFLTHREQRCQVSISLKLIHEQVLQVPELIERFTTELIAYEKAELW